MFPKQSRNILYECSLGTSIINEKFKYVEELGNNRFWQEVINDYNFRRP